MKRGWENRASEIDNSLIIVVKSAGYSLPISVLCVADKEAAHMNDYMKTLHQRFFRKPNLTELEKEIETARQEVRDYLDKAQRRRLMDLVDGQALLREEISLASFTAGFKLAWGIAKELEADALYSSEEETEYICHHIQKED